jgi:hypothetical protein
VGGPRLGLPLVLAPAQDARPSAHARVLVRAAVVHSAADDALVCAAGFPLALLQEAGAERFVVRLAQNATFRRATPPAYRGRGHPPTRGAVVRPLPRTSQGRPLAATPPDATRRWEEEGVWLRAEEWRDLALPTAEGGSSAHGRRPLRPALPRSLAASDPAAPLASRVARALPRPVAGRAVAPGGQALAGRRTPVRACPPRPASGCRCWPCSLERSWLPPRRPRPPSRPGSGTGAPGRRRGAGAVRWRAVPFRQTSRCRRAFIQNGSSRRICRPASGGSAASGPLSRPMRRNPRCPHSERKLEC